MTRAAYRALRERVLSVGRMARLTRIQAGDVDVVRADWGPVAVVACGANPHRYSCCGRRLAQRVHLRRMTLEIWPGLHDWGNESASGPPCPNGHRTDVVTWLCREADLVPTP